MTVFIRAIEAALEEKPRRLLDAVRLIARNQSDGTVFSAEPSSFGAVPTSPFSYWVSDAVRRVFSDNARFEGPGTNRVARQGGVNGSDERWLRLWFEAASAPEALTGGVRNVPIAKGGKFSRFYGDLPLIARWNVALNTFHAFTGLPHRPSLQPASFDYYFRPGLTWPRRTNGLSFRAFPKSSIFADKGPAAFVHDDSPETLLALNSILNSRVFAYLVSLQLARTELAQSYEVGIIQQTPVPELSSEFTGELARLARRGWSLKWLLDTDNETSHAFLLPRGLNEKVTRLDRAAIERELVAIQSQVDDLAFTLYGISAADRAAIEAPSSPTTSDSEEEESTDEADEADDDALVDGGSEALRSWLVGVAFGRFDPRLATGERPIPPKPEPFDPLPSRSPGMYPEGEEPADRPDILVDDEGHADDLAARAIAVAERVKVDVPEDLRGWLAKDFFPLHIKMYSKSRRKAPIYWQLATPSASYSVWLYIHAFSKDTLFRVQNDYAQPKLAHEERRLESLSSELRDGATAAQRKQLAAQEALVEELRAFLDEVKRVAPLWNPDLDDGVILNFAPLWRLVPQNKSWQKELRSTWDALSEGKYDWARLAMHLWPERVVPKCAKDRSLAIAHGLEDVFWIEATDGKNAGKWTARKAPTKGVDELVKERTSPAVKSALKSLLEAPAAAGVAKRQKKQGRA